MTVKLISMIRRRPDITREAFIAYYETEHIKLGFRYTEMCGYRRNYVDPSDHAVPGDPEALGFDVITESIFPDHEAMHRTWARCAAPEIAAEFAEDEERFIDRAATRIFMVEEHESAIGRAPHSRDLLDIMHVVHAYAQAIDSRDWRGLERVFTEDGVLDYVAVLRARGIDSEPLRGLEKIIDHAKSGLASFAATQHFVTNIMPKIDGDQATCIAYLRAEHIDVSDPSKRWTLGGIYRDQLVLTVEGWRIAHRSLEPIWEEGEPTRRVFGDAVAPEGGNARASAQGLSRSQIEPQ